jgi:hypothetical protein
MCHGKEQNVPQHGTKRLLNLCATGRHKMCHSTAHNEHGTQRLLGLCATGRHKICHRTAQNVPQHRTKRLMCHGECPSAQVQCTSVQEPSAKEPKCPTAQVPNTQSTQQPKCPAAQVPSSPSAQEPKKLFKNNEKMNEIPTRDQVPKSPSAQQPKCLMACSSSLDDSSPSAMKACL